MLKIAQGWCANKPWILAHTRCLFLARGHTVERRSGQHDHIAIKRNIYVVIPNKSWGRRKTADTLYLSKFPRNCYRCPGSFGHRTPKSPLTNLSDGHCTVRSTGGCRGKGFPLTKACFFVPRSEKSLLLGVFLRKLTLRCIRSVAPNQKTPPPSYRC